jgi:hypothetical protein
MTPGDRLRAVIDRTAPQLLGISDDVASAQPAPGKWSRKEILGHLIDSASNNHQRFVRANFRDDLVFDGYEQERWVAVQQYAHASWPSLIALWRELNMHLAHVMDAMPEATRTRVHERHNLDVIAFRPVETPSLEWFMNDYVEHLEHHLGQIFT